MYLMCFYVPVPDCERVTNALFAAGAGRLGEYDHCAWRTLGQGQFRPLVGSHPHLGSQDTLQRVDEYKVELVCASGDLHAAIEALIAAHPYEAPAYHVIKIK